MEFFYHQGNQACGVCKSCNRGICRDCASEVINGLACKDKCESEVIELNRMISGSQEIEDSAKAMIKSVSVISGDLFNLAIGILFLGYGIYDDMDFILYLGVVFLLFGFVGLIRAWRSKY
jgi:hypothetical protein